MPTYKYTGAFERAFLNLTHDDVTVTRGPAWGKTDPAPGAGTVVLRPGDQITTPDPVEHPELTETPTRAKTTSEE